MNLNKTKYERVLQSNITRPTLGKQNIKLKRSVGSLFELAISLLATVHKNVQGA